MLHEPISRGVSSFLEALKTGSSTALIGMLIVFAVLAVIFAALVLMRKLLSKKPEEAPVPAEAIGVIPAAGEEPAAEEPASDDTAVIAAIIAAISAHTGKAPVEFRVVSFKRRR